MAAPESEGGGRVAEKLVDPTSPLIMREAEEDHHSTEDASQLTCTVLSSEVQNSVMGGENQTTNSDGCGIAELEQLLMHKTFTRVEFDRLVGLLLSRLVENVEDETKDKKKEKNRRSQKLDIAGENCPSKSVDLLVRLASEDNGVSNASIPFKDAMFDGRSENSVVSNSATLPVIEKPAFRMTVPEDFLESDDEEQLPSPTTTPNDDADTMKSKHTDVISERTISEKHSAQSSQSMPISSSISLGKSDEESFVQPYVTEIDNDFVFSGASHQCSQSSSSTTLLEDVSEASMLVQKSLLLDGQKYGIFGPQTENGMSNFTMPPPRSSEKAQKLFQQIDKLLPSPKENSSEVESVARDQSCSKLTLDMVPESALRSIDDMGSSNFFNMQENCSLDTAADFDQTNLRNSLSKKIDMAEENGPSKPVDLEVKLATESEGVHNTSIPSKDATLGGRSENSAVSNSIALPVTEKPAFRITAPEDLLELDDDEYLPSPTTLNDDADTEKSKCNDAISKTAISEQPPAYFSQSMPFSSSSSFSNADKESFVQPVVTEKDNSFAFSIASNLCTQSKQPSTPTIAIPQLDKPDMQQECTPSPILSFGSQDVNISTVSSTAISFNDPSVITIGEQSGSELPSTPSGGSSGSSSRFADSSSQNSTAGAFGATKGSLFGTQSTPSRSGTSQMSQDLTSQFGSFTSSPSFGSANSSSGSFCTLTLGSATSGANPFTSSSGPTFSSSANYISSFAPASTAIPFGSSSVATASSIFTAISNSNTSLSTGLSFGSSISGSNMSPFTVCSSSGSSSLTVLGASSSGSSSSSFSFRLNSGSSTLPFTVGSSSGSGSSVIFGVSSGSSSSPFTMGSSSVTGSSSFTCGASSVPSSLPFTIGSSSGSSSSPFTFGSSSGSVSSNSSRSVSCIASLSVLWS